jgi:hypothetical protein
VRDPVPYRYLAAQQRGSLITRSAAEVTMMLGRAHVRVIGLLRPGYLKIEHVPQSRPPNVVVVKDDAWIDEVPVVLVPEDLRLANSEFIALVENRISVVGVERL